MNKRTFLPKTYVSPPWDVECMIEELLQGENLCEVILKSKHSPAKNLTIGTHNSVNIGGRDMFHVNVTPSH